MSELLFPLQFKRQYAGALDPDLTFTTEAELAAYLNDPVRYPGQIATCQDKEGYLFIMNNAREAWIEFSADVEPLTKANINVTVGVGGISKGTVINSGEKIEDIIRNILSPYIPSKLTSLNISLNPYASVYEVGTSITIGNATFAYNNDSNNESPINYTIIGYSFPATAFNNSPIPSNGLVYRSLIAESQTWSLTAFDRKNIKINTVNYSISSQYRIFLGGSPYDPTDPRWSLAQSKLSPSQATTWLTGVDCFNTDNYTYICYPAIYSDFTSILLDQTPILTAFNKLNNITLTNAYGIATEYKVYKSTAKGAYQLNSKLVLS